MPNIRSRAPRARSAAVGLYAPGNAAWLKTLGVDAVFGGESEPDLLDWVRTGIAPADTLVRRDRITFLLPVRRGLPDLQRYAKLILAVGTLNITGFAVVCRGCFLLCCFCLVVLVFVVFFCFVLVVLVLVV